ncbi:MAG: hypothetical protein MK008_10780 [Bdellovibrionales bacterium]|nr:hypothetical protein [Bdellovibrionales bacterium]
MSFFKILGVFLFLFLSNSQASGLCAELFVEKSYDQIITQPSGDVKIITSKVNGRFRNFKVFHEHEIEARIVFSNEAYIPQTIKPITDQYSVAMPVRTSEWNGQRQIQDLVDSLIYSTRNDQLSFKPLSSIYDKFHGKRHDSHKEMSFSEVKPGELNTVLTKVLHRVDSNSAVEARSPIAYGHDRIELSYIVGSQRELSIYFDTPKRWLEERGYTARVKTWYAPSASSKVIKKVLTIKKPLSKQNKGFHDRAEISVVLPNKINTYEISDIIKNVLKQSEEAVESSLTFEPVVQVNNLRYGLDMKFSDEKVGFVVIDNFTSQKVDKNLTPIGRSTKPQYQMEIEVLSDSYSRQTYHQSRAQFNELLQKLLALIPSSKLTARSKKQLSLDILENNKNPRWRQKIKPDFIAFTDNAYMIEKNSLRPYVVWTSNRRVQKAAPLEFTNGHMIVKDQYLYFKPTKGPRVRIGKKGDLFKDGTLDIYDPNHSFGQSERMFKYFPLKGKEKLFSDLVNSVEFN